VANPVRLRCKAAGEIANNLRLVRRLPASMGRLMMFREKVEYLKESRFLSLSLVKVQPIPRAST
jgi:hypothetical protein